MEKNIEKKILEISALTTLSPYMVAYDAKMQGPIERYLDTLKAAILMGLEYDLARKATFAVINAANSCNEAGLPIYPEDLLRILPKRLSLNKT